MAREHYEKYKKLLLKLHELIRHGKDQTPEADEVRDQMDLPGQNLTELEHDRVSGLSGDLYMISDSEVKEQCTREYTTAEFLTEYNSRHWEQVLHILRQSTVQMRIDQVAAVRSVCWEELGDYDVALLFAEYALKLKPDELFYRYSVLLNRIRLGLDYDSNTLAEIVRGHTSVSASITSFLREEILSESSNAIQLQTA